MVDIVPFKGLLFDQEKTGPLDQVTAPPYDVIRPAEQEAFYKKNPHNVVRLILGKETPEDNPGDNRYTRSAQTFHQWMEEGILVQDASPAYYVYSQEYTFEGTTINRTGFFARVKLENFSTGNICPHEFTLAKAKKDRSLLLKSCRANFSPIFGLFPDPSGDIDQKLEQVKSLPPIDTIREGEIIHRFWRLQDPEVLNTISESFTDKKIYIADGHHRYETALAYNQEHNAAVKDSAHVMMFLTNLDSPNLTVYSIHRQVRCPAPLNTEDLLARLGEFFQVEALPENSSSAAIKSGLEAAGTNGTVFSVYLGQGKTYFLHLKDPESILPFLDAGDPPELKVLDAAQLHVLVIKSILHIDTKQPENQQYMAYTIHIDEAQRNVDEGKYDLAFFMNPTPVAQVRNLAEKGIRLPQKSTYFYPKLLSGLVINKFEP